MMNWLKSIFKVDAEKKLIRRRDSRYTEAVQLQRSGNLRGYALVMKEIEEIENEIVALHRDKEQTSEKKAEKKTKSPSPDIIDYDGMGNQGRFPSRKKAKNKK